MSKSYYLMHGNNLVAQIRINEKNGYIVKIEEIKDSKSLPPGINTKNPESRIENLRDWWGMRTIPLTRQGYEKAKEILGASTPEKLALLGKGINLNDNYWVKPMDSTLTWEEVNYYDNPMTYDIGKILFGEKIDSGEIDYNSPDTTTDGFLMKRWEEHDNKYYLIKGATDKKQEPFNEIIASKFMDELGIPHAQYTITWIENLPYSSCENITQKGQEFIPAQRIRTAIKRPNNENSYQHLIHCCKAFGMNQQECIDAINKMLTLDYLLLNEDRHYNNFGYIRDAETLKFIGPAPIFDNGNSLYHSIPDKQITVGLAIESKPFTERKKPTTKMQIQFVTDFSWLDMDKVKTLPNIMKEIGKEFVEHGVFSQERLDKLIEIVEDRINSLEKYVEKNKNKEQEQTKTEVLDTKARKSLMGRLKNLEKLVNDLDNQKIPPIKQYDKNKSKGNTLE